MATKYSRTSNLSNTDMNSKYLEIYNPPISSIAIDEIDLNTFTISAHYNKRPDLLAYDELGDSRLWWVFALFNRQKLRDPVNDFKSGVELKIPTKAQIERLI